MLIFFNVFRRRSRETQTSEMASSTRQISINSNKETEILWKAIKKGFEKSCLTNLLEFLEGTNNLVDKRGPLDAWIFTRHSQGPRLALKTIRSPQSKKKISCVDQ